jgi:hypothetical protein
MTDRLRYLRKPDGSWNLVPMLLVAVIITCAVYIMRSDRFDQERPIDTSGTKQSDK